MSFDLTTAPEEALELIRTGYCGRPTRNPAALGPYCKQTAGKRTDHEGIGACWLHGGRNVLKHGRYSTIDRQKVVDLVAEYEETENPLDTSPELAFTRALLHDFVERYDAYASALIAWHESYTQGAPHHQVVAAVSVLLDRYQDEHHKTECDNNQHYQLLRKWQMAALSANPKPIQIMDLADAVKMLSEVTKMVERVRKIQSAQAISRKDFARVMQEIGNIIDTTVTNDREKAAIRDKVGSLRLA